MKDFNTFTNEEVMPEDIKDSAESSVAKIEKELSKMFEGFFIRAKYSTNLGKSISVVFSGPDPRNKIHENSPVHMRFMMHLSGNFGQDVALSKVSFQQSTASYHLKRNGVKFRKINDKTIEGASDKLIKWFKKNRDSIMDIQEKEN